jgi:hypothetical protein
LQTNLLNDINIWGRFYLFKKRRRNLENAT